MAGSSLFCMNPTIFLARLLVQYNSTSYFRFTPRSKVVLVSAMQSCAGGCIAQSNLNFGTRGDERLPSRCDGFTLRMSRCYASNTRLGKPHSRYGRFGKEKTFLPIPEIEPRHRENPELSLVITSTMLACSRSLALRVL